DSSHRQQRIKVARDWSGRKQNLHVLRTLRHAAYSLITLDMTHTADRETVTNSVDKKAKPGSKPGFALLIVNYLDRLNVLGLEALGAAYDVELYALTFLEAAETVRADRREVHEDIFVVALARNEAEALGIVKPLDCTLFHFSGNPFVL